MKHHFAHVFGRFVYHLVVAFDLRLIPTKVTDNPNPLFAPNIPNVYVHIDGSNLDFTLPRLRRQGAD